jgi:drug/metabolite transporter (DMT)-like permease
MRDVPRSAVGPTATDWVRLGSLVFIWGTAFLFTKVAVADLPPMTVAAGRLTLAAVVLCALVERSGTPWRYDRQRWSSLGAMAVLGNAIPFLLITWGQVVVDSGVAGVLMAAMPLTTVVLAHFFVADEPLHASKAGGFALGFAGILVLIGPAALGRIGGGNDVLLRQAAILVGAMCYALNTILARRLPPTPPLFVAAATLSLAALVVVPLALVLESPWRLSPGWGSVLAVVHLGLVATALAMTIYYRVVASAGVSFLALTNYLVPIVAVAAGLIVLGEPARWNLWVALGLVLAGVAIGRAGARSAPA